MMKHTAGMGASLGEQCPKRSVRGWIGRIVLLGLVFGLAGFARAEDAWIELKTPHFTIWSEASEKRTHDWAVEFELFRRGMNQLIPADESYIQPAEIILFRSNRRIRPYLSTEDGKPSKATGYVDRQFGRTIIAISLEGSRDDARDLVYAATLYWHLSAAERRLPDWLEIGLAEVFTTFVLNGDSCEIGADRQGLYRYVRVAGSLPFEQIVSLDPKDLDFSERGLDHTRQVHAQCWAIAQALLFTPDGIGWDAFRKYLQEPPTGRSSSAELEQRFGLTAASLDRRLAAYLDHGKAERVSATFDRTNVDAGFATRPLAPWEQDLMLGSLPTAVERLDDADGYLSRAFLAAPGDGRVREALAIQHLAKHELAEGGREAQQALDAGRVNFFNHYVVAIAGLEDFTVTSDGAGAPPDLVRHLVDCLTLNPRFVPAYEALGQIAPALGPDDTKAADLLLAGGLRYGGEFQIQAGCALVAARRGDAETAGRCLAAAKTLAGSPDSKRGNYIASVERIVTEALSPVNVGLALLRDTPARQVTSASLDNPTPELAREVIAAIDTVLKGKPHAELYFIRATMKSRLNDSDGALADLAQAEQLAPKMVEARELAIAVKSTKLDFAGVVAECDAVLALKPESSWCYGSRAYAETRLGKLDAALKDYDQAVALNPNSAETYNDRGYARRQKGDDDGALSDFNRAIELDPKLARAYFNRAGVRGAKGDKKGAIEDIGRASTLRIQAQ